MGTNLSKRDDANLHSVAIVDSKESVHNSHIGETEIVQDENSGDIVSYNRNGFKLSEHKNDGNWYMHNNEGGEFAQVDPESTEIDKSGNATYKFANSWWLWNVTRTLGENDSNLLFGNAL